MPIQEDIRDDDYFGPLLRQERVEGGVAVLLRMTEKRFGSITPGVRGRIEALKPEQIETVAVRLLDAARIEDLLVQ